MNWWLVITGLFVHLIFFYSIFDIYFTSPLVHGMTPYSSDAPTPAKRLVLFVADGLRADRFFELDGSGETRAPYLRSVIDHLGVWGVSHTHVPTESRPGHVALIAGFYEDVSAVAKGWKENPVEFDSVFNQSRYAWTWGSPDILPIFAKGKPEDSHIAMTMYPAESEDFAGADSSKLDTWVFDQFNEFISKAEYDTSLREKLRQDKLVFFLHLLGLDTNGHSHKPYSKEYLENIKLVDSGIQKVVDLINNFYGNDNRTAYVFTADHGMTDWGSHGASHPSETLTPLVAWGSGVRSPRLKTTEYLDGFQKAWGLGSVQRRDVEQADICPLMAALIGIPLPVNSVGILPSDLLSGSPEVRASAMFANAQQISAQFDVKMAEKKETTLAVFFTPFKDLTHAKKTIMVNSIYGLLKGGHYQQAIEESDRLMKLALKGLKYYHNYDRFFLGASITFGFFGWIGYVGLLILKKHTRIVPPKIALQNYHSQRFWSGEKGIRILFVQLGVALSMLLYVQSLPWTHYLYCLLPVFLWHKIAQDLVTLKYVLHYIIDHMLVGKVVMVSLIGFFGLEIMVAGFFYRQLWSVGLVAMAALPLMTPVWEKNKAISLGWALSCFLVAIFPLLPPVGRDANYNFVILAGIGLLVLLSYLIRRPELKLTFSGALKDHQVILLTYLQLVILAVSTYMVHSTSSSISNKEGLPLFNQIFSWCALGFSFVAPFFSSTKVSVRLLSIVMSFASPFILLSTSHEGLFLISLCLLLFFWLQLEHNLVDRQRRKVDDLDFVESHILGERERHLQASDLICAYVFIFLLYTAFYGTGNIASINSFDPSSVYCFLTIFSPFVMGALMLWKILIPFLLVTCTFNAIHISVNVPTQSLFLLVLLMSDVMALNFFFLVQDEGSWLDIGTSISHYVIVMSCICFLLLLLILSNAFTKFAIRITHKPKKHSS